MTHTKWSYLENKYNPNFSEIKDFFDLLLIILVSCAHDILRQNRKSNLYSIWSLIIYHSWIPNLFLFILKNTLNQILFCKHYNSDCYNTNTKNPKYPNCWLLQISLKSS